MREFTVDCRRLAERGPAQEYLKAALDLPDTYGRNLDALHDLLTERSGVTVTLLGAGGARGYAQRVLSVFRDSALENPGLTLLYKEGPTMNERLWESRAFGQSTDINMTSTLVLPDWQHKVGCNESRVNADGSVTVESRGGKIAGGHDGLTFHFTRLDPEKDCFVLRARVKAENYGRLGTRDTPQQCGFGIMARDALGLPRRDPFDPSFQELPAASNMVFVGVLGGNRDDNPPAVVCRRGVASLHDLVGVKLEERPLEGARHIVTGSEGVLLELGRDERGFFARAERPDGSMSERVYPDGCTANLLTQLEKGEMTVGFFASRNAEATFSDIELTVTPYEKPAAEPELWRPHNNNVRPTLFLRSGTSSSVAKYTLTLHGNKTGYVYVSRQKENLGTVELTDRHPANMELTLLPGENPLECVYDYPSGSITETFTVTLRPTDRPTDLIYAAPDGREDGAGSETDPVSVAEAVRRLAPGGTILLLDGTYTSSLLLTPDDSGALDKLKTLKPAPGAKAVFRGACLTSTSNFWHIYGIEFTGKRSDLMGSFNVIEKCEFHHCDETGLVLGKGVPDGFQFAWPCYNLIKDCVSYGNRDPRNMNADGFAPKLGVGPGNVFEGCVSHGNIDDGFDLYNKVEKGPNAPVVLRNCVAYQNGIWVDPEDPEHVILGGGGGNGFKLGGEGMPVGHTVENCVAFGNFMAGFSDNFNPGPLHVSGCVSVDNDQQNFIFRDNPLTPPRGVYRQNISIRTRPSPWRDSIAGDVDGTNRLV